MTTIVDDLIEARGRLDKANGPDNALDMAIDIALFEPDRHHVSVRANAAGTKLVYTRPDGKTDTFWAQDHTLNRVRRATARDQLDRAIAKARSLPSTTEGEGK